MFTYYFVRCAFSFLKSYYSSRSPQFYKFALWSTNTELLDILLGHVLLCTLTRKIPKFLLFDSHIELFEKNYLEAFY